MSAAKKSLTLHLATATVKCESAVTMPRHAKNSHKPTTFYFKRHWEKSPVGDPPAGLGKTSCMSFFDVLDPSVNPGVRAVAHGSLHAGSETASSFLNAKSVILDVFIASWVHDVFVKNGSDMIVKHETVHKQ